MGNWKGVSVPFDGEIQLYDLRSDLGEETNVADEHPEVVAKIERIVLKSHVRSPDWKFRKPKQK